MPTGPKHVVGLWHKYPDCGDEISYDAPGVNIPTSTISRIGEMFKYYHTSLDTPDVIDKNRFEKVVSVMSEALSYMERDALLKRKFSGNPSLANPTLNLYLESKNLCNQTNKAAKLDMKNLETGAEIDLRNFMEYFLSNLDENATLLDIAFEARLPFEFVAAYANEFAGKKIITLKKCLSNKFVGNMVKVSLNLSGTLELD